MGRQIGVQKNWVPLELNGEPHSLCNSQHGMVALDDGKRLRVTYGIGDCISATRDLAIVDVAALLSGRLAVTNVSRPLDVL